MRIVGKIKLVNIKSKTGALEDWDEIFPNILFSYRTWKPATMNSLFEILLEKCLRVIGSEADVQPLVQTPPYRNA